MTIYSSLADLFKNDIKNFNTEINTIYTNALTYADWIKTANWKFFKLDFITKAFWDYYQDWITLYSNVSNFIANLQPQWIEALYNLYMQTEMLSDKEIIDNLRKLETRGDVDKTTVRYLKGDITSPSPTNSVYTKTTLDDDNFFFSDDDTTYRADNIENKSLNKAMNTTTKDDYNIIDDFNRVKNVVFSINLKQFLDSFTYLFKTIWSINSDEILYNN